MRTKSDWSSMANYFGDSAQRVAFRLGRINARDHLLLGAGVQSAQLRFVGNRVDVGRHFIGTPGVDAAEVNNVTAEGNVEFSKKPPANGSCGHARGGLARRRSLQHVTGVVTIVLEHS